jgi:prephenate dehydrogenase
VAAASLANVLSVSDAQRLALQLAAGSFRDGTRVAGSEPWLSASMVKFNRAEVLRLLEQFQDEVTKMMTALRDNDDDAVLQLFSTAHSLRRAYESVKSGGATREVEWPTSVAIEKALTACQEGSLISKLVRNTDSWQVVLEGFD